MCVVSAMYGPYTCWICNWLVRYLRQQFTSRVMNGLQVLFFVFFKAMEGIYNGLWSWWHGNVYRRKLCVGVWLCVCVCVCGRVREWVCVWVF